MDIGDTPKYVMENINAISKNVGFVDYTISVDNATKHGDGFMASMIGITIKGKRSHNGNESNSELPLICKLMPESGTRRENFSSVVIFEREVYFYNKVLPMFVNFLRENQIDVNKEFSIFPKCYIAFSDPVSD